MPHQTKRLWIAYTFFTQDPTTGKTDELDLLHEQSSWETERCTIQDAADTALGNLSPSF